MRTVRYNTFETNSSSTHSLAVPKKVEYIPSDIRFHFGDFGWQLEDGIDPANYLYTGIVTGSQEIREKYLPKLKEVMKRNNIKAKYDDYESSFFINRNKKALYDWKAGKNSTNPYYMENCDDYDWFYKGN